jgi:hypothetical protein
VKLELHQDVIADLQALPDDGARGAAIRAVADVRAGRRQGAPLDYRTSTGDLRDCRKVYFDTPGSGDKPRFRLIYLITEQDTVQVLAAEVVAVGLRENLAAYVTTARRPGRIPSRP